MKKIGILKLVLLVSLLSFTIFSCNENPMDDDFTLKNQSNIIEEKTLIILGEQYPNPYSVSNMLNAYQYLKIMEDLIYIKEQIGYVQIYYMI